MGDVATLTPAIRSSAKFRTGDVVVLKSGGPALTVRMITKGATGKNGSPDLIRVNWFVDGEEMTADFLAEQLVLFDDVSMEEADEDMEPLRRH